MTALHDLHLNTLINTYIAHRTRSAPSEGGLRTLDFDSLTAEIKARIPAEHDVLLLGLGASVERAIGWVLAPLLETGAVSWDPVERTVQISELGLSLIQAESDVEAGAALNGSQTQEAFAVSLGR